MVKKTLLSIALVFCVLIANGQTKISPYSLSFLRNHSTEKSLRDTKSNKKSIYTKTITKGAITFVDAFVTLNEGASASSVVAEGAIVYTRLGDILTVQVPINKIVAISELNDVKRISVAKPIKFKNDKSRVSTGVSKLQAGTGLQQAYTGKGVVVGGVDGGVDINHIAFTDEAGKSRVKRAYLPADNSGTPPSGTGADEKAFSGSEYTTPEEIAKLTTDDATESHGTHTISIAAGGYKGNGLYGMAPESDIVIVAAANSLSDVNIANGVDYIFKYANSENKPAVVNLSLGDNQGPHDGSTQLNDYFDSLSKKGNVIVVSAGNEGADKLYINKKFTSKTDELKTFLIDYQEGSRSFQGSVDAWSKNATAVGVKVVVYSTSTKNIVYQSKVFKGSASEESFEVNSSTDTNFAKYYEGYIYFWSGVEYNDRYNSWCEFDAYSTNYESSDAQPKYKLGLVYTSEAGNSIDVWADDNNTYLSSEKVTGWTDGNSSCSINDFVTTNSVISVGAYSSRENYKSLNGETRSYGGLVLNDIADFSSYGVDFNGVSRPDVTAPGFFILSAVNSYDVETVRDNHNSLADEITVGGRKYQWGDMAGTSMSSPAVAGIVALWLQADPTLDVTKVREVINATSVKDSYVKKGNPVQWGAGKIDAYAGLVNILKSGVEGVVTDNNAVIMYPNPSDGQFTVYAQGETSNITLRVYSPNGALVASKVLDASQGEINVDLSSELTTGLYIVQIVGEKVNHTSRLIIK